MTSLPKSRRCLAAVALAAMSVCSLVPSSASAGNKTWSTGYGTWGNASNWSPNAIPSSGDNVLMGASAFAHDATAYLDVDSAITGLSISNGMSLDTFYHQLTVNGSTTINGTNQPTGGWDSDLTVFHTFGHLYDLQTNNLNVTGGGRLVVQSAKVNVMGSLVVDGASAIYGGGTFDFYGNGGTVFTLDGSLDLGVFGQNPNWNYTLNQHGTGRIDLDGGVVDDNSIDVGHQGYSFTVNGDQLTDAYDDTFFVSPGASLNMNLSNGWTLGTSGWLVFDKTGYDGTNLVTGGTITCNGTVTFIGGDNILGRIEAPLVMNASSTTNIDLGDTLDLASSLTINGGKITVYSDATLKAENGATINGGTIDLKVFGALALFNGPTTVNGGQMQTDLDSKISFNALATINGGTMVIAQGGTVEFNAYTKLTGGTFKTFSTDPAEGQFRFNGTTEYAGTVNMTGVARQNGSALVNNASVINADVFDMDGQTALTTWTITAPLTLNVDQINAGNNVFTGTMNITSTPFKAAGLTVNLPAGAEWTDSGQTNLTGAAGIPQVAISGSPVKFGSVLNVTNDNVIAARATFGQFSATTINANSSLRLDGGSLASPNRIEGGTVQGTGTLMASVTRALTGFGTIATPVDFPSSEIRADGGTLSLSGAIASVGIIAAQPNGTLRFGTPFNSNVSTRLELNGGTITGATVTNSKETRGFGTITTSGFVNNGSINVTGGSMLLDTNSLPDLDGTTETGALLLSGGDLHVADAPSDAFNGSATISQGRTLQLDSGWTLGAGGSLNMQGNVLLPTTVRGTSQTIAGAVNLTPGADGKFDIKTTFASGANVSMPGSNLQIELLQDGTVNTGANFSGAGTLRNLNGARLNLASNSAVASRLENNGTIELGELFSGAASVGRFAQTASGVYREKLYGSAPGTGFDRMNVTETVTLAGNLQLSAGLYNPAYMVSHEMIHATGGVVGQFGTITGIALSPTKYLAVTYDADSVLVTAALPGDANLDGTVSSTDFNTLAVNFALGGKSWSTADFTGDGTVNSNDFNLLASNFGKTVPSGPGASVPEPDALGLVLLASSCGLRRRARRV